VPGNSEAPLSVTAKRELTIEAEIYCGDSLLCRVAEVLRSAPTPPECFVWSTIPESNEARVWLVLPIAEIELGELMDQLRHLSGVRCVTPLGPGTAILGPFTKEYSRDT
jgi:hypothetical protein